MSKGAPGLSGQFTAGNERGQPVGIIADTDQEGRRELGEPLQAKEIEALDLCGTGLVARAARGIEYRDIDPAEIEAVTGGPDD
jgi:hypothetical protein